MSASDKRIHRASLKNSWKAASVLYKEPITIKGKLVKKGLSQQELLEQREKTAFREKSIENFGEKNSWIGSVPRPYHQFPDNPFMDSLKRKYVREFSDKDILIYSYTAARQKTKQTSFSPIQEDPMVGEVLELKRKDEKEISKLKVINVSRDLKRRTGTIECKKLD